MARKPVLFIQHPAPRPTPSRPATPRQPHGHIGTRFDGDGREYFSIKENLASDLRRKRADPDPWAMMEHVADCANVDIATASEHVERFVSDIDRDLKRRKR